MWSLLKKALEDSYKQHDPTAKENVSKYIHKVLLTGVRSISSFQWNKNHAQDTQSTGQTSPIPNTKDTRIQPILQSES